MTQPVQLLSVGRVGADLYADDVGVPLDQVSKFNFFVGGTPANVAVGAQRLGIPSALASRVGDDGVGEGILRFLQGEGVDTSAIIRDPDRKSGLVVLGVTPPDDFPLVFYRDRPADEALSPGDLAGFDHSALEAVFIAGTNLLRRATHATSLAAIELAREHDAKVILDVDHRSQLWKDSDEFGFLARSLIDRADIVIGTEEEIAAAGGAEPLIKILRPRGGVLVVKRGMDGCEVIVGDDRQVVKPYPVEVLNTFGAGDAFAAGFTAAILRGLDPFDAARMGNAAGAHVVTKHACANDMPTLTEIEAIMERTL